MNDFLVDVSGNNYGRNAYVNKNYLLTTDNKYAYINSKGVIKPYDSMADYGTTYGKNQCGGSKINITSSLANLPLPIGKQMVPGQSCGNENTYVRYDFPARMNDVASSWLTDVSGRAVGTLPYPSLLSDMAKVGKAGYIDVDSTYHSITPTFSNTYGSAIATYITGETSKMENCSPSSVTMKYGDKIILLSDNHYLQKNSSNSLIKSTFPTEIFILPANNLQQLGSDVHYGDDVLLSLTESLNCGNNCAIGGVTYLNEFKFGSNSAKHVLTITSADNADSTAIDTISTGTPVKFTENVFLEATVYMNRLRENQMITNNGNGLKSNTEDGMTAYLTYSNGKIRVQVNNGTIKTLNTDNTYVSGGYLQFLNGRLYIKRSNGTTVRIYPSVAPTLSGNAPYELFLSNNGLVVVLDANRQIQWQSDPALQTDMVYDGYMVYASLTNNTLKFNNTAAPQTMFRFSKKIYGLTNTCDVESLKKKCVDVSGCTGFLHSPTENTWMKMMNNAAASDYAVSEENTNAYLRNMTSDMKDSSCPSASYLQPLPATLLNGYPVGKEMSNTGNSQCNIFKSALNLTEYEKSVNEARKNINNFERNDLSIKVNNLEKYYANINKNKNEYTSIYNLFNEMQQDNVQTGDQQLKDSAVIESQEKTVTFIWGIVSISMLMIILFRPRLNTV